MRFIYFRKTDLKTTKTDQININDRYKSLARPERALTPIGEQEEEVGSAPTSATLTRSTTIDVEAAIEKPADLKEDSSPPAPADTETETAEEGTALNNRPIGPKPAKVVDANTISLSAFMHFAPKN